MGALGLRLRVWARRSWARVLVTGVLVGLVGGTAMALAAGTRRTASAPDRYTAQAGGDPDLYVTQLQGRPLVKQVAALAAVDRVSLSAFVPAFPLGPDGSPIADVNPFVADLDVNGARIVSGRAARGPDEFVANDIFADYLHDHYGMQIGDTFSTVAVSQESFDTNGIDQDFQPDVAPFQATFVGVYEAPADFDDPSATIFYPPAFLDGHPDVAVVQTLMAIDLAPGASAQQVVDAIHLMPNGDGAYNTSGVRIVSAATRRAVAYQTTALWLVTAIAALAAAVVIAMVVARAFRTSSQHQPLLAIGWTSRQILQEQVIEGAIVGAISSVVAGVLAAIATRQFPLGQLHALEPDPGIRVDGLVIGLGVGLLVIVAVVTAGIAGRPRRSPHARRDPQVTRFQSGSTMTLTTGAAMAATTPSVGRRSVAGLVAGALGVAGVLGAFVVGSSVDRIVDHRSRWGINYDDEFGNAFTAPDHDIVTPLLADPDLAAVSGATIGSLTLDGKDVDVFAVQIGKGDLHPTVIDGQFPRGLDEIAIGAETARHLHVGIGDAVDALGPTGLTARLRVVGTVVTPDNAGAGVSLTMDAYAALSPGSGSNLVMVRYAPGAPADTAARVAAANYTPPEFEGAMPASIRALRRVTTAPLILLWVLTGLLVLSCAYVLAMTVRARQHDLAVIRALGGTGHQLRSIVRWQATVQAAIVLLGGIPLGVVVGRLVVRRLTDALGVVPGATVPVVIIAYGAIATLLVANALAIVPGRRAARADVASLGREL